MGLVIGLAIVVLAGMLFYQAFRLVTWLGGLVFPAQVVATGEVGTSLTTQPVGTWTRFSDWLVTLLWPFRPPARVRLAFPCPACYQPLLGKVAPGEDLICPWCRTTFQTPEPPPPAPPVSRKVVAKKGMFSSGFWRFLGFTSFLAGLALSLGLIFIASLLLLPRFPQQAMLMAGILFGIWGIAWFVQAVVRRVWNKGTFLPPSIIGEGGGTVLLREIYRTLVTTGLPIVLIVLGALVVGCLGGIMGAVFGLGWGS